MARDCSLATVYTKYTIYTRDIRDTINTISTRDARDARVTRAKILSLKCAVVNFFVYWTRIEKNISEELGLNPGPLVLRAKKLLLKS